MKTFLITGGAGFIGSHLCEKILDQGNKVICVDNFDDFYSHTIKENNIANLSKNSNFQLYKEDIRDETKMDEVFSSQPIDFVIHLAAMAGVRPSIERPLLYQEVNVKGTNVLLELAKKNDIKKFIFASSSSVYGNTKETPFEETQVVDFAISPYAATKKAGEVLCHVYHHLYNIDMVLLRFFTVYGPRQRPDLAIHKFTKMIDKDQAIPFFGDGTTQRDYTYIDDIIQGIMQSVEYISTNSSVYEIFNLGENQTISLNTMVETIEDALSKKAIKDLQPMQPGDVVKTYANIDKAKNMIGYQPTTDFSTGIAKFVSWYRSN